ncbi:MAG: LEA type 2 family protein [Burkholderiaceae bacterium]
MSMPAFRPFARRLATLLCAFAVAALAGCATFPAEDPPVVRVAGLQPLPSQGLELRFALTLRVQNPRDTPIRYDGVALSLDLDGRGLGSGVSPHAGSIERFGEALIEVPVSISLFSAITQALGRVGRVERGEPLDQVPYSLTGKLGSAEPGGAIRFSSEGKLSFPQPWSPPRQDAR